MKTQLIAFIDDLAKENAGRRPKRMSSLWTLARHLTRFPHNGLLYKLFKCGIDDITLQWLKSFLEKRRQSVVFRRRAIHIQFR